MSASARRHQRPGYRITDQPLSVQFLLAGAVVAAFVVASLFLLLTQVRRQAEVSRDVGRAHRTIDRLHLLGRDFYYQRTAFQEWLAAGSLRSLASFREREKFLDEGFRGIMTPIQKDSHLYEQLVDIQTHYDVWKKFVSIPIELLARTKKETRPQLSSDFLREEAFLFKKSFLAIDRLIDEQKKWLEGRDDEEKNAIERTFYAIAIANVVLLLIFSFVLHRLYIAIARPISDLSVAIEDYQSGDFSVRVQVSSDSEIGYLEGAFNEMAERIESMVEDLRKLDELKTDFLSTVSHELRTPLTSIAGYVKLLTSGDAGTVSETQKEFLGIVDTNVGRLTNLINDLLDVEKIESGKIQLVREKVNLGEVLKETKDTFDILAKNKGLELHFRIPDAPMIIYGDRSRFVQIFMNLVSNAIKYTPKGKVEILAEMREFAITVRIQDSGVGIGPDDLNRLFQKFYRTKSALKSTEGGTGLGLLIVRGLVEAHGGKITVESILGQGTTFIVNLPIRQAPVALETHSRDVTGDVKADLRSVWVLSRNAVDSRKIKMMIESDDGKWLQGPVQTVFYRAIEDVPRVRRGSDQAPLAVIVLWEGAELTTVSALRTRVPDNLPVLLIADSIETVGAHVGHVGAVLSKPVKKNQFLSTLGALIKSKKGRLLLAHTDADIRLLLRREFQKQGFQVDDVDRGNEVLARLKQEPYDLLVMEDQFSDISGEDLVRLVRKDQEIAVALISDAEGVGLDALKGLGVDVLIKKHQGIQFIGNQVRQYFERRGETDHG